MPVVDATIVLPVGGSLPSDTAQVLADAVATALGAAPGRVWVRLHVLPAVCYAENHAAPPPPPVFLRVLHAKLPAQGSLAAQAMALAQAVAASLGRPAEHVHVEYAAPGAGRVAFGGRLLT